MKNLSAIIATVLVLIFVGSCKENIDKSDQFTFTDETIISYLEKHDTAYSEYLRILGEVKVSRRSNSTLYQLLTARGNYTVFAPTNRAIQKYLDTLYKKGIITEATWDGFPNKVKYDSIQAVIAFNSIIDGGDEVQPFQSSAFPEEGEEFPMSNMNDRRLKVHYDANPDSIYINDVCLMSLKNHDIPAINGYIHAMHDVIAPSNETVGDVFAGIIDSGEEGYLLLAKMLQACGLLDTLTRVKDEAYEDLYQGGSLKDDPWKVPTEGGNSYIPEHRYLGFTIFAEPDALWEQVIGKPVKQITLEDVRQYIQSKGLTPGAVDDENYKDVNNSLNQFVTYHILPMRIPKDKLVIHYNERGFTYGTTKSATIPVFEYYTTMGKRRLLKIYESRQTNGGIYLNRFPKLRNGRRENYNEVVPCDPDKEGIHILTEESSDIDDRVNGIIYPIERVLAYDNDTRSNLQKERIRFDVTSIFPEFMNNNIRVDRVGTARSLRVAINPNSVYPYLNDLYLYDGCKFNYLSGFKMAWNNYQGDELNVVGNYEMIFRLPPVPRSGTYEIRYLVGAGSSYRGLCQVYFGESNNANGFPFDKMVAQGIPLDLRMGGLRRYTPSGNYPSIVGWEEDTSDDEYNAEVDKKMRANGFMKAPNSYICFSGGSDRVARIVDTSVRRIIVTQHMDPEKVYYLGFKNVMDDDQLQFYMDFLEYCAKEVYDNPYEPEDIW